jgi:exodeoxyribonuclease VII large subunit
MHILTVSELTRAVKDALEAEFPFVWVRGQVSNVGRPASGHVYFTLGDGEAVLQVVWFKGSQWGAGQEGGVHPLTGEVLEPGQGGLAARLTDGQEVLCAGRINVYAPRGQYQLVAELVQEQGVGDLHLAFEALKRKLAEQGYFDEDRKMVLPRSPERVALITSPSGAAVRDFLRIASERGFGCEIRVYPVLVQGDKAPAEIVAALDAVNAEAWAEVIALVRGGGSLEDLWAFNTEPVAEALFRSRIPVITGIGHEPDVSIADYVADRRAATPSHAAQELWPLRADLAQAVDQAQLDLDRAFEAWIGAKEARLSELRRGLSWLSPVQRMERLLERFQDAARRLVRAGRDFVDERQGDLAGTLDQLLRTLEPKIADQERDVSGLCARLTAAGESLVRDQANALALLEARLAGLDPEGPLDRGYSLVTVAASGRFLRSVREAAAGQELLVRVRDGRLQATVDAVEPD